MSEFQQFLYVFVKETVPSNKQKTDTVLRIVFWKADEELGYDDHFVIYGTRPRSKTTGKFVPYRLTCETIDQVQHFVKTVVGSNNSLSIELHQFYGYNDDSEDWYNIDWKNTPRNSSTEIVAYDVMSQTNDYGEYHLNFHTTMSRVLNVLVDHDTL